MVFSFHYCTYLFGMFRENIALFSAEKKNQKHGKKKQGSESLLEEWWKPAVQTDCIFGHKFIGKSVCFINKDVQF